MRKAIVIILVLFLSCNYANDEKLGDGYYIVRFYDKPTLIYSDDLIYKGEGTSVLPEKIVNYDYNSNYIIVKTIDSGNYGYWLINKKNQSIQEMDSIMFYKQLHGLKVKIRFEKKDSNIQ